jgi:membrane peptidoglycan carboxypeptidase
MKSYYDVMLERGRMTEEQYQEALEEPPRFAKGNETGEQPFSLQ